MALTVTNQTSLGAHSVWSKWPNTALGWDWVITTFGSTPGAAVSTPCAWLALG
jgi:hypothetical protein